MPTLRSCKIVSKSSTDKSLQNESPLDPSTPSIADAISNGDTGGGVVFRRRSLRLSGISTSPDVAPIRTRKRKGTAFDNDLNASTSAKGDSLAIRYDERGSEKKEDRLITRVNKDSGSVNLRSGTRSSKRLMKTKDETLVEEKLDTVNQVMVARSETESGVLGLGKEKIGFEFSNFEAKGAGLEGDKQDNVQIFNQNIETRVNRTTRSMNLRSGTRSSKRSMEMEDETSIEEKIDKVNQMMVACSETHSRVLDLEKERVGFELSKLKGNGVESEGDKCEDVEIFNQIIKSEADKIRKGKMVAETSGEIEASCDNKENGFGTFNHNSETDDDKIRKGKMIAEYNEEIEALYGDKENGLENEEDNLSFEIFNEISCTENGENLEGKLVAEPANLFTDKDEVLSKGSNARRQRNRSRMSKQSRKAKERNIAMQLAPKFAFFKNDEKDSDEEEQDELLVDDNQVEDWPGPFSTAMKIIRDREQILMARELNSSKKVIEDEVKINWSPSKGIKLKAFAKSPPTLYDLCMKVLCENAEEIESLDGVPDALRHRLASYLCRVRKMGPQVLCLLANGSPAEIHMSDCSWATEGEFEMAFGSCNLERLKIMELNLSGRCLPDYVLKGIFAKSPNSMPLLTKLSLKGNYRLSDDGLNAITTSAPLLSSVNLSQCSLITSAGINSLVDKLELVLRELYIDECPDVNAMLILPSLIKLKHLEILSLAGIESVTNKFVKKLLSVCGLTMKELVFSSCRKMTSSSIKVIGENCPHLCSLDLRNLNRLNDTAMGHLANGCRSIQKLKLRRNAFSDEAVAAFVEASGGSLSVLSLNNIQKVSQQTAIAIARRCSNLRSLDLSFCRSMTNEGVGLIVDSCSSLKLLKLFGCTQIDDVFLEGHSNPNVKIVGSKGGSILDEMEEPVYI